MGEELGEVGRAAAVLGVSAVAGLTTTLVWTSVISSLNCRLALFSPSLTATGNCVCKALWSRAVVGREERLSSVEAGESPVATPKLLVFESRLLAVCSV